MENTKPLIVNSAPFQPVQTTAPVKASEALQNRFARAFYGPAPAVGAGVREQQLSAGTTRQPDSEAELAAWANAPWSPLAMSLTRPATTARPGEHAELGELLSRLCSAMYVGDKSVNRLCVVLALDHVLPGAAAEIVREGIHLTIRLRTRTEQAYELMSSQRQTLLAALAGDGDKQVQVIVVRHDGRDDDGYRDG
jgi:hypothetical protein